MPNIFISYRRDDSPANARLLYDRLRDAFSDKSVFMDVAEIGVGDDWQQALRTHIELSDFVLVVIGRQWLNAKSGDGQRRLDDADDFVRWEIAESIRAGKTIIPVLVDGAVLPAAAELPDEIARLPDFQAQNLAHLNFEDDVQTLIARLGGKRDSADLIQAMRERIRMGNASVVVFIAVAVCAISFAWINLFDLLGLDTRTANFTMLIGDVVSEPRLSDELILVGIKTTAQEGARLDVRRREQYAQLIDKAAAQNARRVVFDLKLSRASDFDAPLHDAIQRAHQQGTGVVFGFDTLDNNQPRIAPGIADSQVALGLTCVGERLGNVSYGNLTLESSQGIYASLAFQAAYGPTSIDPILPDSNRQRFQNQRGGADTVRFSLREVVDRSDGDCPARIAGSTLARLIVPLSHKERWRDPARRIAMTELLADETDENHLRDKIVLVGAEHPADVLKTRLDGKPSRYGFEFHADTINALLTNDIVRPVGFGIQWLLAGFAVLLVISWRIKHLGKPNRHGWLVLGALCAMIVGIAVVLYVRQRWLIDSLYHLGAVLLTWWLLAKLERRWSGAKG